MLLPCRKNSKLVGALPDLIQTGTSVCRRCLTVHLPSQVILVIVLISLLFRAVQFAFWGMDVDSHAIVASFLVLVWNGLLL